MQTSKVKAGKAMHRYGENLTLNAEAVPIRANQRSLATLRRFAFRLAVVGGFAALWPNYPLASAITALSIIMATSCLLSAAALREPCLGSGLNRWDEAIALLGIALLTRLIF
jgi:hypothetical protein